MVKSKFQTIVNVPDFRWKTGYTAQNMFLGSCFTENVGNKMAGLKYDVDINPFGILYNPLSVANGLEILLKQKVFTDKDLKQHNGVWHSFSHHGRFSAIEKEYTLKRINSRINTSADYLRSADFLFITFGTAWVYRLKKSGEVVANCHKIPAKAFLRERISVQTIAETYKELLSRIWCKNPKLKVLFTVSPIRHWKDGAIENQRSKSTLLLAIDELIKEFGSEKCAYFPSYEIVMDELRDYRFYGEDMLHLTDVAVNHIWERFEQCLVNAESTKTSKEIVKIINAVKHRPINKKSLEYSKFLLSFQVKTKELEQKYPFLNLKLEKEYFNVEIKKIEAEQR